jgi:hypothetical protein
LDLKIRGSAAFGAAPAPSINTHDAASAGGKAMTEQTHAAALSDMTAATAPCPKCATTMILAAITPHPIAAKMERHTFLCVKCNQTKTYMLPAKDGERAALR